MDMIEIGARLKARREYLELSQQEVADAIHKERSSYAQYESGKNEPSAETLYLLGLKLRVPVGYFYAETEQADIEGGDLMRYYNGLPPNMKGVARQQLKALFDAQDSEARELEFTTYGKKTE